MQNASLHFQCVQRAASKVTKSNGQYKNKTYLYDETLVTFSASVQ